ncbi:hypothetical protein QYE76_070781 [Lolium multiflorum]|uniref:Uncharacterized protein n=1 Tax=Lolium multiflorum TaxID=4521 RepID=A0AAD8SKA7_LOLMU|nr:hypothetical protein QYE76_070781 [Lolium multiflorum]
MNASPNQPRVPLRLKRTQRRRYRLRLLQRCEAATATISATSSSPIRLNRTSITTPEPRFAGVEDESGDRSHPTVRRIVEEMRLTLVGILVGGIQKRRSQKPPILHSLSPAFRRKMEIVIDLVSDRLRRPSRKNQGEPPHLQHLLLCPRIAGNPSSVTRRTCSTADLFSGDAPVAIWENQPHHGTQRVARIR